MKLSFLAHRNFLKAAVTIAVLMPTMAVGGVIERDSDSGPAVSADTGIPTFIMSDEEMAYWIAHTDAQLTFIGDSINPLSSRSAETTTVTYCSSRIDNVCGGRCTVYTGGAACLNAPDTNCLAATNNVGFCSGTGCRNPCNQLSTCGVRLDYGYCYTPGTVSIAVTNV
ncbi:hypothetical protein OG21DRAFT_1512311 [Imleria badia]|nr:hypothetical protein OG21DRAFT_1512311 [Imleria badia]